MKLQYDAVNVTVNGTKDVVVYSPEYFKHLETLLKNTPNR